MGIHSPSYPCPQISDKGESDLAVASGKYSALQHLSVNYNRKKLCSTGRSAVFTFFVADFFQNVLQPRLN